MQEQRNRRVCVAKGGQGIDHALRWEQAVQHDVQLAFQALQHACHLGAEIADAAGDQARLGQHDAPGLG